MNLFWKKLFGGITSTSALEKYEANLLEAMQRYTKVEQSVELAEYKSLSQVVKSPQFQETKKVYQNRKYKDTEESKISKRFDKLASRKDIKFYYEVASSAELLSFLEFKKTPDFQNLSDSKKVKASELLQRYYTFKKSKEYAIYTRFHESFVIKEYEELKLRVAEPAFIESNNFWRNSNRWHTTSEFKQQERYYELAKNPDIIFYERENPERFKQFLSRTLVFQDGFDWNTLTKSDWNFGFCYKSPVLIGNHSFANEKQANNNGRNVSVENNVLKISTKREKIVAKAWHQTKGFLDQEFEFTSDVLQNGGAFSQKYGVFQAKLRCTGSIHHAFWLGAEKKLPHINVFHYDGKNITLGNANENLVDGIKITGIKPSDFYIYTLVWTERELFWMINDYEVYRTASNVPQQEMYLAFNSFISGTQKGTTGSLEVDWVKVYSN